MRLMKKIVGKRLKKKEISNWENEEMKLEIWH